MGNTTSIASNILVFPVPKNPNSYRKKGGQHRRSDRSSIRVQSPQSPGISRCHTSTSQATASRSPISSSPLHSPRSPGGPHYLPSPTQPTPPPSLIRPLPHPHLNIYHILPPGVPHLTSLLHALCTSLRDPADRILRPSIFPSSPSSSLPDRDWIPTTLFHLTGDFSTPFSSALCSILLTRTGVSTNSLGEEDVLGQHQFIHIFEAGHLAQSFEEMIGEWEQRRWVREVKVGIESGVEECLEACALGAVGSWVSGMEEDGAREGIGERMMERAEEVYWALWLGVDDNYEDEEMKEGKWQFVRRFISRFDIW